MLAVSLIALGVDLCCCVTVIVDLLAHITEQHWVLICVIVHVGISLTCHYRGQGPAVPLLQSSQDRLAAGLVPARQDQALKLSRDPMVTALYGDTACTDISSTRGRVCDM